MLPFYLLFAAFVLPASAQPRSVILPRPTDVRRAADATLPPILELPGGERVWVFDQTGEFSRVKVKRAGRWTQGFVFTDDLEEGGATESGKRGRWWGVGLIGHYSVVSQPGRKFQTQDSVTWTTSAYQSTTTWPAIFVQYARENFWRLTLGLRSVHFRGTASANVGISNSRRLTVDQVMYSGRLERAFTLYKPIYLIIGGEVARGTKISETLDGKTVPTTDADLSVYAGGSAGLGASLNVFEAFTLSIEARYGVFPSLKPAAVATDVLGLASYWF